jgi:hypothetical protein
MAMSEQNPLQIGFSRIGSLDYHVPIGPEPYDYTKAYKAGIPISAIITNFTQTVGTENQTTVGFDDAYPFYGGFTWRDIPKAKYYVQFPGNNPSYPFVWKEGIHASFQLVYSDTEGYYDLITTVVEASNGHKYWLGQTVTVLLFYTDDDGTHSESISYEFTEEDWDTSPAFDDELGTGYIANAQGPSKFVRRQFEWMARDAYDREFSIANSTTIADPQSPFQPPGD